MYIVRNGQKTVAKIRDGDIVEKFTVDWKSPTTWAIIVASVVALFLLIWLIILIVKKHQSESFYYADSEHYH